MHSPGVRWPAVLLAVLLSTGQASAQTTGSARLSPPLTDNFPSVRVYLDVRDDLGRRVVGLRPADVSLTEDQAGVRDLALAEVQVGVRQIVVLNSSDGLRVRDTGGRSRFDVVRQVLLDWWGTRDASPVGIDDLTLMAAEGTLALHAASAAELAARLDTFRPTFEQPAASLDLLMAALRGPASDANLPGRPTHILFATGLIETPPRPAGGGRRSPGEPDRQRHPHPAARTGLGARSACCCFAAPAGTKHRGRVAARRPKHRPHRPGHAPHRPAPAVPADLHLPGSDVGHPQRAGGRQAGRSRCDLPLQPVCHQPGAGRSGLRLAAFGHPAPGRSRPPPASRIFGRHPGRSRSW